MILKFPLLLLVFLWTPVVFADNTPTLAITYYPFPPGIRVENGKPVGRYIDMVKKIAEKAQVQINWVASGFDDEANLLDNSNRDICTTGRMATKERVKRWAFLPYVFDIVPEDIVLSRPEDHEKLLKHGNIISLVQDPSLVGVFLESGIYGNPLDTYLAKKPDWILRSGKPDFKLIELVMTGRAHYTVVPANQWEEVQRLRPETSILMTIPNYGTHPAYPIFIACSRSLKPEMLKALSDAMGALGYSVGKLPR